MKSAIILGILLSLAHVGGASAQASGSTRPVELDRLDFLVGSFQGEIRYSTGGQAPPPAQMNYRADWKLDSTWVIANYDQSGGDGRRLQGMLLYTWDPQLKRHLFYGVANAPMDPTRMTGTMVGNLLVFETASDHSPGYRETWELIGTDTLVTTLSYQRDGEWVEGSRAVLARTPPIQEGYVLTPDSVRLYYRVVGSGEDVVIAPMASRHGTRLDRLARNRRLVLYDPRGRGRSAAVLPSKVSLDHQLRDLDAIRQAVGADRAALIGWSGLGMELWVYAARNPNRVTRLVQLAPVPPRGAPYMEEMMRSRQSRTDTMAARGVAERNAGGEFRDDPAGLCRAMDRVSRPASFGDPARVWEPPDVCIYPNEWGENLGPYFGALLGSFGAFDWRPQLAAMTTPRLVIHGDRDNIPLAGNREWVAGQPNARLLVIEGAGHWPHYEQPERVLPAIEAFLTGQWPPASARVEGGNSR